MKTCLVSLISDQTIPNILVAASIRPDYLLFISTAAMEKKHKIDNILESLSMLGFDFQQKSDRIIIPENSIPDINEKMIDWVKDKRKEYNFTVNLTCGTKLMSLAAYEIFKGYGAEIIYMPLPENVYFPVNRPESKVAVNTRLSVDAYLAAYGVKISNPDSLKASEASAFSKRAMTCFIYENYKALKSLLKAIGEYVRPIRKDDAKKGVRLNIPFNIIKPVEKAFIDMCSFSEVNGFLVKDINQDDWDYLRGAWLEERTYLALKDVLPPEHSDIHLKINCKIHGNDNEFDVLFTLNNVLYVVECKSLDAPSGSDKGKMGGTVSDFLYKLGALRQNFGLTPRGVLASTSEDIVDKAGRIKSHLNERGRLFSTEIWPLLQINDLDGWIREKLL